MIKILFMAANPKDTDSLRLGEEVREIKERLRLADLRDEFTLEQEWAVRVTDLQGHLLHHQPHIVHFSGHGAKTGEVILEDQSGASKLVSPDALKRLFKTLKDNIRCVVLNACYSEVQANGIAKSIDCVIGMTRAIADESAIAFAASFYQALGYGRSIQTAFDLGCVEIEMQRTGRAARPALNDRTERELVPDITTSLEDDNPMFKVAPGVDPATIYLAASAKASQVHPSSGTPTPAGPTNAIPLSASETAKPAHHACKSLGVKRWVFQLEVRERSIEPTEALSILTAALEQVITAQGSKPVWQITQVLAPSPGIPNQFQIQAVTYYPPGGVLRLGGVAVKTRVAHSDYQGPTTLLTLNFVDNLGWRVPYSQVQPTDAVRQKYPEPNLGYAETVFDTTVGTAQDFLIALYGPKHIIGVEQDALGGLLTSPC